MCLEWNRKIIEVNRRFPKVMFDYRMVINSKYHVNWDFTSCKWDLTWFIVANPKKNMQDCSRTLRYEGGNWVDEEVTLSIFSSKRGWHLLSFETFAYDGLEQPCTMGTCWGLNRVSHFRNAVMSLSIARAGGNRNSVQLRWIAVFLTCFIWKRLPRYDGLWL